MHYVGNGPEKTLKTNTNNLFFANPFIWGFVSQGSPFGRFIRGKWNSPYNVTGPPLKTSVSQGPPRPGRPLWHRGRIQHCVTDTAF